METRAYINESRIFFQKETNFRPTFYWTTSSGRETSIQRPINLHIHNAEKENIRNQYETGGNYIGKYLFEANECTDVSHHRKGDSNLYMTLLK